TGKDPTKPLLETQDYFRPGQRKAAQQEAESSIPWLAFFQDPNNWNVPTDVLIDRIFAMPTSDAQSNKTPNPPESVVETTND
ncbi:MAG: hypothetical protein ACRCWJ_23805, partial [Casimicrobium sp.]